MAGVYIHIPFCHSKCAYCDFYSTPNLADADRLIDRICEEYRLRAHELSDPVTTVYFGGGTPSILPSSSLGRIVDVLPMADVAEFTIEANPEDVTSEHVRAWRRLGVNRVSMGVQSLVDSELSLIGRRHTAPDALRAVDILRQGGIDNISLDLIYGLPTQSVESWHRSLEGLLALHPQHLSAYMLSYEPHTRLTAMLRSGRIVPVSEDVAVAMYQLLIDTARLHGYEHYEISNFALPGRRAMHNSSYWNGTPYLGLGPAAHSFDGKLRRINPSSIREYMSRCPAFVVDRETRVDRFNDMLITRLRTADGLDFANVPMGWRRRLLCAVYPHLQRGSLVIANNRLAIPESQWLVSDAILRDLIMLQRDPSVTSTLNKI